MITVIMQQGERDCVDSVGVKLFTSIDAAIDFCAEYNAKLPSGREWKYWQSATVVNDGMMYEVHRGILGHGKPCHKFAEDNKMTKAELKRFGITSK